MPAIRYPKSMRYLHLLIAALMIIMLAWGLLLDTVHFASFKAWHRKMGLVALVLVLLFLSLRCYQGKQPYPATMPLWQQCLARIVQVSMWLLLLIMPISGWAMATFSGKYAVLFNWPIVIPGLSMNHLYASYSKAIHQYAAFVLIGLIVIHSLAALYHRYILKDGVWQRMLG